MPIPEPTSLREEVTTLIKSWPSTDNKPPFTTGELIVVAFVVSEKDEMEQNEAHSWILYTFPYDRRLVDGKYTEYVGRRAYVSSGIIPADSMERLQLSVGSLVKLEDRGSLGLTLAGLLKKLLRLRQSLCWEGTRSVGAEEQEPLVVGNGGSR
ncbi:hypothetical protein CKM354_000225400 [Cercospora kikuchii]|uniref:Uncharacterized protein n=1 Tax=Cercospora kikuchii TaxID=84275 RepID=A0A9P3CED3_9PEZI|nr:uncharacterized protein CKM354_000225400 [Cercospora kikuchii]GIZ38855.1 hypothetical protein CKM354_000225400 [Cercospora kikuchii]